MKSRGAYETPGGTLLVKAHPELERLTIDRETAHFQQALSLRYSELVYYGLWFAPLREALDGFFQRRAATRHRRRRPQIVEGHPQRHETRFAFLALRADLASFTMGPLQPQGRRRLYQSFRAAGDGVRPKAKAEGSKQ